MTPNLPVCYIRDKTPVSDSPSPPLQDSGDLPGDRLGHRRDYSIAELAVGLSVGNDDRQMVIKAHQTGRLARGQAARVLPPSLRDENLGAVLVVPGTERAGDPLRVGQSEAEAVPLLAMPLRVRLEVAPELIAERVARIWARFEDVEQACPSPGNGRKTKRW